jgi:hypothetical protein
VVPNLFAQSFDLFLDFLIGGGTGHDWEIIVGAAVYPVADTQYAGKNSALNKKVGRWQ